MQPVTIELRDASNDPELAAISRMSSILDAFDTEARARMLTYLVGRYPSMELEVRHAATGAHCR